MLWSITENLEDLGNFPSGSQVHSETGHGTSCGQADYTGVVRRRRRSVLERKRQWKVFRNVGLNISNKPPSESVTQFDSSY